MKYKQNTGSNSSMEEILDAAFPPLYRRADPLYKNNLDLESPVFLLSFPNYAFNSFFTFFAWKTNGFHP